MSDNYNFLNIYIVPIPLPELDIIPYYAYFIDEDAKAQKIKILLTFK